MYKAVAAIILVAIGAPAWAQMTPEGLWRNVDDKTGEAKAEIRIRDTGAGGLLGVLEKRLSKDAKPDDVCKECTDDRKDKPVLGLAHGVDGLVQAVERAVGLAYQRSGHGHVGPGNLVECGHVGLTVRGGLLQLAQQFGAGRDDDVAHRAAAACAVQFVLDALGSGHGGRVLGVKGVDVRWSIVPAPRQAGWVACKHATDGQQKST